VLYNTTIYYIKSEKVYKHIISIRIRILGLSITENQVIVDNLLAGNPGSLATPLMYKIEVKEQ
jgi:hypothetical protein